MAKNNRIPDTARLTGTAILAALVIVFDYALKLSGLKIPFPWMPFLKFDFTGIPIVVAFLLFGLPSASTTSVVASLGIIARSARALSFDAVSSRILRFGTVLVWLVIVLEANFHRSQEC